MKHNPFLNRSFAVTAITLGMLSVSSISNVRAEESIGHPGQEALKTPLRAEDLESCTLVTLNRIFFHYEQNTLSTEEKATLDRLASRLSRAPQSVIELRGYTDGMESAQHETVLGAKRSQTIADYLEARGVRPNRILVVATGETDDQDKSVNPQQRRVDVRVFTAPGSNNVTATRQSAGAKPSKGA